MNKQIEDLNVLAFISGVAGNLSDELPDNFHFKRLLKKYGNLFLKEMAKYENLLYTTDVGTTEEDQKDFYKEITNSYIAVDKIIRTQLRFKNDNQRNYFANDLDKLIEKYNLETNKIK